MSNKQIDYKIATSEAQFLIRKDVEEKIKKAFTKQLTTVIAGVGYGKTQTVLRAIKTMQCKPVWLQFSQLDNNIGRFWARLADAFEPYSPSLYKNLLSLGYPESIAVFDQFLRVLAKEFEPNDPLILVFDDVYLIDNKKILNFIEIFVSAQVQNISIVIISRIKPDLNLSGFLSKGLLACITEEDLRFSKEDTVAYFRLQGLELEESLLSKICSHTDGWIFAIFLVGLAIKKGDINRHSPILPAKTDIFDLIDKEVFLPLTKDMQDFLVKISVMDSIPSGFLKELLHRERNLTAEIQEMNSFIQYNSLSDCYRIHHLFREFLMEKKKPQNESDVKRVHFAAAQWHEKNNNKHEAIAHYKECGNYEKIFDIILSISHHVSQDVADSIIEFIEQAPEEIVKSRPLIQVAKARYMINNNKIAAAQQQLLELRKGLEAHPEKEKNKEILGEIYLLFALISIINVDYEFEAFFKMADQCLPAGSKLLDNNVCIAEGINVCTIKDPSAGELKRHEEALFNVAPYASRVMNGCGYGTEYLNAAESGLYMTDFKGAEKNAYEAIYRSRQYKQYDIEYMANFVLARIFLAKGNFVKIAGLLDQMKNQLDILFSPYYLSLYDVIKSWFYVKIGKIDKVSGWIMNEDEKQKVLAPVILGREYLVRSDCLLAQNRYYELLAFMEQTDHIYRARGILFAIIQNTITRAIIYHAMGNHEESMEMLSKAYELSNPNDLTMQYMEYGNKMRTLMLAAKKNGSLKLPEEWIDTLYTKASTYAKHQTHVINAYNTAHGIVDKAQVPLSNREKEVLTYLCQGLTRGEIASSCYLSKGTINSLLKSIYDKIGAANAADAVRIAKEKYSF